MSPVLQTIVQYILWSICWVLGLVLLVVFRAAYFLMLVPLSESGFDGNALAVTFDKVFMIVGGLVFIVFLVLAESYIRKGREEHVLWGRFARLFGMEIFILCALHASIAFNTEFSAIVLALLGAELITGVTAVGYSYQVL